MAAFFMALNGLFIGLTTIDIQYFVDSFPGSNVKVKTNPPDIYVGGPATNAAVAFSFLGENANLASPVGKNSFSSTVLNDFKETGITHFDIAGKNVFQPILATVVTSQNGDRNIFTYNPDDINSEISADKLINEIKPNIILIDGFFPEIALHVIRKAKKNNIPVILDGGSWKPQILNLLPYIDYAICSENFLPPGCSEINEVFESLKSFEVDFIAITRGEKPILFLSDEGIKEIEVSNTDVVDTLGAGDFFHGAFAYYILKYKRFEESLMRASKLASMTCKFQGTRKWLKCANRIHY
ncbi:MAG: sugar kinase [Mariniphaga sp.]|nr:sugar kinase [Mariniphaga sp.]